MRRRLRSYIEAEIRQFVNTPPMDIPSAPDKSSRERLLGFFEHPLFTLPVGSLSGLIGMFYFWPILGLCGACILLAFHRSGAVKGKSKPKKVLAYAVLFIATTLTMYGAGRVIDTGAHVFLQEIAEAVKDKLKPLFQAPPRTQDAPKAEEASKTQATPKPSTLNSDLWLTFMDPEDVILQMFNPTDFPADDPKFYVALMDLDFPEARKKEILPFPSKTDTGDYVRPHDKLANISVLSYHPEVRAMVNKGDRLFGWATITCRNCIKNRGYWLYFIDGKGGWYSEMSAGLEKGGKFEFDLDKLRHDTEAALNGLVSPKKRISIPPYH